MSMVTAMPAIPTATKAPTGPSAISTRGFIRALDQFLSSNDAGVSASGSSTLSNLFGVDNLSVSTAFSESAGASPEAGEADLGEVDLSTNPGLCLQIASLLQSLGFQVRPEDIAQLSPLDTKQLDSALEFVQRNLERGLDPSEIAECASLLLPRPWSLDDLSGAPVSSEQATAATTPAKLPEGFQQAVDSARQGIAEASTPSLSTGSSDAKPEPGNVQGAQPQKKPNGGATQEFGQGTSQQEAFAAWTRPQDSLVSSGAEAAESARSRHLPPGGLASELIGKQVLEKVQVQLAEGRRELSLRLWPEELGEVRLSLRMSDNHGIQANMVVENDAVRQAMLDSMPQLRDAMARHGLDLEKMTVNVGSGESAMAGSGSEADRKRSEEGHDGRRGGGFHQTEIAVATRLELGRDTGYRNGKNSFEIWS